MSVLVIGSVALDTIQTPFGKAERILGGSATYFSLACSIFNQVKLVAVVGDDLRDEKLNLLSRKNIDLGGLEVKKGKTFRWHGKYFDDLNYRETVELKLGVFEGFKPTVPKKYQQCEYIFLANIDPKQQYQIVKSADSARVVAADTIDHWIENQRNDLLELLKKINILILNDSEARLLSGEYNLLAASRWIQSKGPNIVVIKKGEHGVLLFREDDFFVAPAYPLEEIFDPTGAGDAFAGGFIGYLSTCSGGITRQNLRTAVIYGQIIGSFCVEEFGVKKLLNLNKEEVNKRLNYFKKLTQF